MKQKKKKKHVATVHGDYSRKSYAGSLPVTPSKKEVEMDAKLMETIDVLPYDAVDRVFHITRR